MTLLNPTNTEDLLTVLGNLDSLHSNQSQEKLTKKAAAWFLVLEGLEYEYALKALTAHYKDPNAKSLTVAVLRAKALLAVPVTHRPENTPEGAEAHERACMVRECNCTHTICRAGWLDEETTIVNKFGAYPAVQRCPTCKQALEARGKVS